MDQIILNKRETYHNQIRKGKKESDIHARRKRFIGMVQSEKSLNNFSLAEQDEALRSIAACLNTEPSL